MAEISIPEEEFGEPSLNYWKPVPRPPPALPILAPGVVNNTADSSGWPYHESSHSQQLSSFPLTDVIHSYIQNQQIGLSSGRPTIEGERRRMPQCSLISADHVIYTLSANPSFEQDNQTMTDNMIQDEVTRAAKTLFSKRNRTLLHWLNPDVNKNQIKIDVNAAWESLPAAEKMFYISQVLGKFSPHVTSLMVNPQLEPANMDTSNVKSPDKSLDKTSPNAKVKQRVKKSQNKNKSNNSLQVKTEDEESCDSGLVVDMAEVNNTKVVGSTEEKPRVKRKYTKRKRKERAVDQNVTKENNNSCPDQVNVKQEPKDNQIANVKVEPDTEFPVSIKNIKKEPDSKEDINNNTLPKPKRKYVKRKLVRKKYKRREPKLKPPIENEFSPENLEVEQNYQEPAKNSIEEMEMDLWIELGDDTILTNEEVDSFFNSIEDPDSLFRELGIIEN